MPTIKHLTLDDYDAICDVWMDSGVHLQVTGRESRQSFAQQMASGIQTIIGVEQDGVLIGVALATHDSRKGWISRLGVRRANQRQGIGRLLIEEAERVLHAQGMTIIAALVEHENEASLGLFRSEGFQVNNTYYLAKRDNPNV